MIAVDYENATSSEQWTMEGGGVDKWAKSSQNIGSDFFEKKQASSSEKRRRRRFMFVVQLFSSIISTYIVGKTSSYVVVADSIVLQRAHFSLMASSLRPSSISMKNESFNLIYECFSFNYKRFDYASVSSNSLRDF